MIKFNFFSYKRVIFAQNSQFSIQTLFVPRCRRLKEFIIIIIIIIIIKYKIK